MLSQIIRNSFTNMWPMLVIVAVTLVTIRVAYYTHHSESFKFYKEFWTLLSVIYIIMLYQLVTKVDLNTISTSVNLVPFKEILRYNYHSKMFLYNVVGNIVLFIPFGFIVASYVKPKKVWTNLFIAIIISTTIEFVQLKIGRCFDIDDILLNSLGCVIGFLFFVGWRAIERHLPDFLRSDWIKNLFCIIISICVVLYVLEILGITI